MKANLNIARKTLKRSLIKFFASLQNKSLWSDSRPKHGFFPAPRKLHRIIDGEHKLGDGDQRQTSWPCSLQSPEIMTLVNSLRGNPGSLMPFGVVAHDQQGKFNLVLKL